MKTRKPANGATTAVQGLAGAADPRYSLRLYVAGLTPRSARAIANLKAICEEHLEGRYDLQVIDIYQQPVLAEGDQIIAVPTLLRELPRPLRRIIGDLSDRQRVLVGLDLKEKVR